MRALKTLFSFVIKADLLARNPVSRVKFLAENNQQTRVLNYTEQQSYLSNASPVLRDVAILILETGMRPEEVYTIRPENVELLKGHQQTGNLSDNKRERNDETRGCKWRADQPSSDSQIVTVQIQTDM